MNRFLVELEKGGTRPKKYRTLLPVDVFSSNGKESQTIEWKSLLCYKGPDSGKRNVNLEENLMKEICGMANSGGGHIFWGLMMEAARKEWTEIILSCHQRARSIMNTLKDILGEDLFQSMYNFQTQVQHTQTNRNLRLLINGKEIMAIRRSPLAC